MKAYKIAMFLVLFEFSIPVASAIGFTGPIAGTTSFDLVKNAASNPGTWLKLGTTLIGILGATRIMGLRMNMGAAVFGITFTVGAFPLEGLVQALSSKQIGLIPPAFGTLITSAIYVVFLFAFIQLSSSPAKGAY